MSIAADAVRAGPLPDAIDQLDQAHAGSVQRDGSAAVETDHDRLGLDPASSRGSAVHS